MYFIRTLYLHQRFYWAVSIIIAGFLLGHFFEICYVIARYTSLGFVVLLLTDAFLLWFGNHNRLRLVRLASERFSNGDENSVQLFIQSAFTQPIKIEIRDEIPEQFQIRNFSIKSELRYGEEKQFSYKLIPKKRGEYIFGKTHVFVSNIWGFLEHRFSFNNEYKVKVYPSFLQLKKYEILAITNRLNEAGIKKVRKPGQQSEFDQIRSYVEGDDIRKMNWKATARKSSPMVNQFQDEKSQQIWSVIDMGRTMKMPFAGMTLLDYAINASLVLSKIALNKDDKAGLVTFSNQINCFLPASNRSTTMPALMEALYNQKTNFCEADFFLLYTQLLRQIKQRSLIVLFTNFESTIALERQLPYLKKLAARHLVVVVTFLNSELKEQLNTEAKTVEQFYLKAVIEKMLSEKNYIRKTLEKSGILTVFCEPQQLTVSVLNKYIELKSSGRI